MMAIRVWLVCFLVFISSCKREKEMKFDKERWNQKEDAGQPSSYRKKMLKDLTENYKLVGLDVTKVIGVIGQPNFSDGSSLSYDIVIDYNNDIDPVYIKQLALLFSRDSIIKSFKVTEWRK